MILSALVLASSVAQSQTAALPAGYHGFEAIARALSTPEAPVTAAKSLRRRVVYLDLKNASPERLRKILRATSDVILVREGTTGNRLRLEPDPAVLRREARDRDAVVARLRAEIDRIRLRSEELHRSGEAHAEVTKRAADALRSLPPVGEAIDARTADAYAQAEIDLWASFVLNDYEYAENRVAFPHVAETLAAVDGDSFADPPRASVWTPARVDAAASRLNETPEARRKLAENDGLLTVWKLQRGPGRISLAPHSRWLAPSVGFASANVSTAGFLPGDAQRTPTTGIAHALYVGVPGSRWWGPVVGPESRTRYAGLEAAMGTFLATEGGQGLKAAFAAEGSPTFSDRLRRWAHGSRREIAFELSALGDAAEPFESRHTLPGFSTWRVGEVDGAVVGTNLLDFIDRAIPIETLALTPLLKDGPRKTAPLTEDEVRGFYRAAGPAPYLEGVSSEYYGLPIGTLNGGGAAFLVYEAIRARPEARKVLRDGGRAEFPLDGLPERTFVALAAALGRDPFLIPHLPDRALAVVQASSVALSVKVTPQGRRATIEIRPKGAAIDRYGFFFGLESRVEFLAGS